MIKKLFLMLLAIFIAGTATALAQYSSIGILGNGTAAGWGGPDIDLATTDGVTYTLNNVSLTSGGLKFRENDGWDNNWGGTGWPSGTGIYNNNDIGCQPGVYNITFNRTTLAYSFTYVYSSIGIRGAATSVGWDGSNDIMLNTTNGITYTAKGITLTAAGLKFRENNDWPNNWGGTGWPAGTGIFNQDGVDIPCHAGTYDITFNRQTLQYSFQYTTISIIGDATPVGWNGDIDMATTDGITYTLSHVSLGSGGLKFRQSHDWPNNWGGTDWPSGTGLFYQYNNIPCQAGLYNISFNRTTLAYNFTAVYPGVAIIGPATTVGWNGPDIDMATTDGITYTLNNVGLTYGNIKFRENDAWDNSWGGSAWPSGTATLNQFGVDILAQPGVYNITFNKQTMAYSFVYQHPLVGIRGNATTVGWDGVSDIPMSTTDGINYTLDVVTLTAGGLKFREGNDWANAWGGTQWNTGTASVSAPSVDIPCQPGVYSVSFNRQTLAYSFTYLYPSIGVRGSATTVGWNGPADIPMATVDGVHYTLYDIALTGGGLKFREDNAFTDNWGGTTWPAGVGVHNQDGVDVPCQPGIYNVTYNRLTLEYNFIYQYAGLGIRGSATTVGWDGPNDIVMNTTDGITYTVQNIVLTAGGLKFRENNDWPNNWGGSSFPTGTGIFNQDGVDIPCQPGIYNIAFNRQTLSYIFTAHPDCYDWTGLTNSDWNTASNWCGFAVPGTGSNVTISLSANAPLISSGTASANNITLNAGAVLTVATGATLDVQNNVTVATGATLTVQNNGALVQHGTTNTNSGAIVFHKNGNALYRLDYTIWASPVSGQNLLGFSAQTSTNRFYTYVPTPAGGSSASGHYQAVTDPASTTFADATGYLIRMPNSGSTAYNAGTETLTYDGTFTGTPHNGNIAVALSTTGDKYTAVGNPYPSPIGVAEVFAAGNGVLDGATPIYFWRKKNDSANTNSYYSVTTTSYNINTTAPGEMPVTGFTGDPSAWTIAPGQGFFLKTGAGSSFTFTNSMRKPATSSQTFFRSATSLSRLWISLTDTSNGFSQASIAYMAGATTGLDYSMDGRIFTTLGTSLYSIVEGTSLAIQTRPAFNAADVVPMAYTAAAAGKFTIALDHADGVFTDGQAVYLNDKLMGVTHNFADGAYIFTTEAGTVSSRFEVVYTANSALGTAVNELTADSVVVYKQGNTINISSSTTITGVFVYDVRGRLLYNSSNINTIHTAISNLSAAQEVVLVQVATDKGTVTKKIVY